MTDISAHRKNAIRPTVGDRVTTVMCYLLVTLQALLILVPIWTLLMDSFSGAPIKTGLRLLPDGFTFDAYESVLSQQSFYTNFLNSVLITVIGTVLCVVVTFLTAYPLSKMTLPFNRALTYIVLFTMYFSGGLVPQYLLYKSMNLLDNRLVLILPSIFSAYYALVMRNFLSDIPAELEESAKLDGANDLVIAFRIYLPLAKPIIATVALWTAVGHWNDYFAAMIYITTPAKQVLQVMLRRILIDSQLSAMYDDMAAEITVQTDAVKAVNIILTMLPIICTYPFAQKYFIKGLTSGAVKG